MDNKVVYGGVSISCENKKRKFLNGENRIFCLEIDFYMKKNIESAFSHGLNFGSYHILMKKKIESLWSKCSALEIVFSLRCMVDVCDRYQAKRASPKIYSRH